MRVLLSSLIRGGRAAVLLVAAACATPDRASAECGDYVTILNAPAGSTHSMPATTETGETPAPMRTPCRGPNCQGAPVRDFPPLTPVSPVGSQVKEQAQCLDAVDRAESQREILDRDSSSSRPIHRPTSIFHPPRLG
jgi:hypothetical protein